MNNILKEMIILGPRGPKGFEKESLFELDVEVPGLESFDVIRKTAALRVLLQRQSTELLSPPLEGGSPQWANRAIDPVPIKFSRPVFFEGSGFATNVEIYKKRESELVKALAPAVMQVASENEAWPIFPHQQPPANARIGVPRMRLVSGVMPAGIKVDTKVGKLLQLNKQNSTILGGLSVKLAQESKALNVTFTPDGIEFVASVPAPIPNQAGFGNEVPVTLLFTWDPARSTKDNPHFQLRLVADDPDSKESSLDKLDNSIAELFAQLRTENAPLSVDYNTRLAVPPLSWRLDPVGDVLQFAGMRDNNRNWIGWSANLDGDSVRSRLVTAPAGLPQDARLAEFKIKNVQFQLKPQGNERQDDSSSFEVTLNTSPEELAKPDASCVFKKIGTTWSANPQIENTLTFTIDADVVAKRLLPLYQTAGALSNEAKSPEFAFVPVERGWLQLPFVKAKDLKLELPQPAKDPIDVMTGEVALPFSATDDKTFRTLDVTAASQLIAAAQWRVGPADRRGLELQSVTLKFAQPQGGVTGLLFVAETSPTAVEILPNLQAGPVATRDLPLIFGADLVKRRGFAWGGTIKIGAIPSIYFEIPKDSTVWRRLEELPALPNITMTRTAAAAEEPSVSRGLIPEVLTPGRIPFQFSSAQQLLPEVKSATTFLPDWKWAWTGNASTGKPPDWGEPGVSLVLPTLPGLELAPGTSLAELYSALRFDIPILDELFASAQLPVPDKDGSTLTDELETPVVDPVSPLPSAPPTSLEPKRLAEFWKESFQRLARARTQAAYVTPSTQMGSVSPVTVKGLVEPYEWQTTFQGIVNAGGGAGPVGRYLLDGLTYEGESAANGMKPKDFELKENKLVNLPQIILPVEPSPIKVVTKNLAAARIQRANKVGQDSRGFAVENDASVVTSAFLVRESTLTLAKPNTTPTEFVTINRKLVTARSPLRLKLGSIATQLWFRDLAMVQNAGKWTFIGSANLVEAVPGNEGKSFDSAHLPEALHEWRFYEEGKQRFDIDLAPFRFRPLRLWSLELEPGKKQPVQKVSLLGRLTLDLDQPEGIKPFGTDDCHGHGNLVLLEITSDPNQAESYVWTVNRVKTARAGELLQVVPTPKEVLKFFFDAVELNSSSKDDKSRVATTLKFKLPENGLESKQNIKEIPGWELCCQILGSECTLLDGKATLQNKVLTVDFSNPANTDVCALTGASFVVGLGTGAAAPSLTLNHEIRIAAISPPPKGPVGPTVFHWRSKLVDLVADVPGWFGLKLKAEDINWNIDHSIGRISLDWECKIPTSDFIPGLHFSPGERADLPDPNSFDDTVSGSIQLLVTVTQEKLPRFKVDAIHLRIQGLLGGAATILHQVSYSVLNESDAQANDERSAGGLRINSLTINGDLSRTSIIEWPKTTRKDPTTVDVIGTDSLAHKFTLRLRDHSFPLAALDSDGQTLLLKKEWAFTAVVSHSLTPLIASAKKELSWSTLDQISVSSVKDFQEKTQLAARNFAFAPFKFRSDYRGESVDKHMAHSGIARSRLANTGFRDSHFLEALEGASFKGSILLILGGSVTGFIEGTRQLVASMHYCASGNSQSLPEPFNKLAQVGSKVMTWNLPDFDLADRSSALNRLLPGNDQYSLRPTKILLNATEEEIGSALKPFNQKVLANPVQQIFFQPKGVRMPKSPAEVPYFLRTLLVLREVWDRFTGPPRALATESIISSEDSTVLRLAIQEKQNKKPTPRPFVVALSRVDGVQVIDVKPEDLSTGLKKLDHADDEKSGTNELAPAKLFSIVRAVVSRPLCIVVEQSDSQGKRSWTRLDVPRGKETFGHVSESRFADGEVVPASSALGWPSGDHLETAGQLVASIGNEGPIVSQIAGLAGRTTAIGWPAYAPEMRPPVDYPEKTQEALYLDFSTPAVFERDSGFKNFRAPAPRHLSPIVNRRRAPLYMALGAALNSLVMKNNTVTDPGKFPSGVAPISAPQIETGVVGLRPGVFHVYCSSMTVPAEDSGFDPNFPRFGRPASSGPAVVNQLRSPRGTPLPLFEDLATRRRTYLSMADRTAGKLDLFQALDGPAVVFRHQKGDRFFRFILRPEKINLGPSWNGELTLKLETAFAPALKPEDEALALWRELYAVGLLPLQYEPNEIPLKERIADSFVQLLVGDEVFHFQRLNWSPPAANETWKVRFLSLFMTDELLRAHDALRLVDGDTPVRLLTQFAPRTEETDIPTKAQEIKLSRPRPGLRSGPPLSLILPLQVAAPDRPVLPLKTTTVAFGDPSYDRQLGSPAQIGTQIREDGHFQLALDRSQYNSDATVHFAFGVVAPDDNGNMRFKKDPVKAFLIFKRQPAGTGDIVTNEEQILSIDGVPESKSYVIQRGIPYAITLRSLRFNGPIPWRSGDQLIVQVSEIEPVAEPPKGTISFEVRARIVLQPQIAPAPSVFSVVGRDPAGSWADVPLHACAPLPQLIEFPDLIGDLAAGHVRRQGLFVWAWTEVSRKRELTLIKMDRSGGAQIPLDRFQEPV